MLNKLAISPSLQLWETTIEGPTIESALGVQEHFSQSEYQQFSNIKSPKRANEYLVSRWLIRQALSQTFNVNNDYWEIEDYPKSLPHIKNMPIPLFYSLSHSKERVSFAISENRVGLDLEKVVVKKKLVPLAEQFMHSEEIQELISKDAHEQLRYFYFIWSAKEAYYKMLRKNEQVGHVFSEYMITPLVLNNKNLSIHDLSNDSFAKIVIQYAI